MTKFIFIVGNSGSGKSTAAIELENLLKERSLSVSILSLDHYYLPAAMIDHSKPVNFDVPGALDEALIETHLKELEAGRAIKRPTYSMIISDRVVDGEVDLESQDVIIVEGIFAGKYGSCLKRETERFKIYIQSPSMNDNYTRKESRDVVERQQSEEHRKKCKKNQIGCFFEYIATHQTSSDLVLENTWQPPTLGDSSSIACSSDDAERVCKSPMFVGDALEALERFLSAEPRCLYS